MADVMHIAVLFYKMLSFFPITQLFSKISSVICMTSSSTQIAPDAISEHLKFKKILGGMPPDPLDSVLRPP